jgi:hypothetical protein
MAIWRLDMRAADSLSTSRILRAGSSRIKRMILVEFGVRAFEHEFAASEQRRKALELLAPHQAGTITPV